MLIKGLDAADRSVELPPSSLSKPGSLDFPRQTETKHDSRLRQLNTKTSANTVSIEHFMAVIDWLMNQRHDSAYSRFCLFRIVFENPEVLGSTFGAAEAMRRLNQFGALLAATVRHTDLVTRDRSVFWTLTAECDAAVLCARLNDVVGKAEDWGLDVVPCSVGVHAFPLEYAEITGARILLDHLARLPADHRFVQSADYAIA